MLTEIKVHNIHQLLEAFKNVKVLIVGDLMLDRYFYGDVKRISPEAPVPVVNITRTSAKLGGAANVALNVAGLGAVPYLIGVTGRDAEAADLKKILYENQINGQYVINASNRQTTVKTRIVAHQQHIVRLDQETTAPIDEQIKIEIRRVIEEIISEIDIIVVSDYAKGLLTENLLKFLINLSGERKIKILIDPKGKNYQIYKGATILTPNLREAAEACNLREDEDNLVKRAGQKLLDDVNLDSLLITQGENGMTLFQKNGGQKHLSSVAREVYDVTGAGDTVISTLAVCLGAQMDLEKAAEFANRAAGIVVEHVGTTAINQRWLSEV